MVFLALVAKIRTKKGNWRTVPIDPNYFLNSFLAIKPLKFNLNLENDETNKIECNRMLEEVKKAEANPYIHTSKSGVTLKIHNKFYMTMVKSKIAPLVACRYVRYTFFVFFDKFKHF